MSHDDEDTTQKFLSLIISFRLIEISYWYFVIEASYVQTGLLSRNEQSEQNIFQDILVVQDNEQDRG